MLQTLGLMFFSLMDARSKGRWLVTCRLAGKCTSKCLLPSVSELFTRWQTYDFEHRLPCSVTTTKWQASQLAQYVYALELDIWEDLDDEQELQELHDYELHVGFVPNSHVVVLVRSEFKLPKRDICEQYSITLCPGDPWQTLDRILQTCIPRLIGWGLTGMTR